MDLDFSGTRGAHRLLTVLCLLLAAPASAGDPVRCVGCRADGDGLRAQYSEEQWKALEGGDVITTTIEEKDAAGAVQSRVTASGIVPAPPARIWAVVTDFESFKTFLPDVEKTQVRRRSGNRVWIQQHLRVMFVDVEYGSIYTLEPELGLASWELDPEVPADVAANKGFWELVPLSGGARTLVRYHAEIDTGRPIPGFVERALTTRSLPKVVAGLRDEVARRDNSPDQ